MAPITIVAPKQYFTDGSRLYYIVKVNRDKTVVVENCYTLFTHMIHVDTIYEGWRQVALRT